MQQEDYLSRPVSWISRIHIILPRPQLIYIAGRSINHGINDTSADYSTETENKHRRRIDDINLNNCRARSRLFALS